jgi:hypothetical protein
MAGEHLGLQNLKTDNVKPSGFSAYLRLFVAQDKLGVAT